LALGEGARRATGAKANSGRDRECGYAALQRRFRHMLLRFEDVLEGQAFPCAAQPKTDFEAGFVAAEAVESYDLCKSGFDFPSPFFVKLLSLSADSQRLLECRFLVFALEDVNCFFPGAESLFAFHHHCLEQLRVIPRLTGHFLPPFRAMVLRKR